MDSSLECLINLYVLSTGRRLFALQQTRKIAAERGFDTLTTHIDEAIKHDQKTRSIEASFAGQTFAPKGQSEMVSLDIKVDRLLVSIRDVIQSHATDDTSDDAISDESRALLIATCPRGIQAIIQSTFVEELAAIDGMLSTFKSKRFAPLVAEIGLTRKVKTLEKLAKDYRAAQEKQPDPTVAFNDVRAARATGQNNVLQAVAMIIGAHPTASTTDVEARNALLAPILAQNEAVRVYLRSHRLVQDVDPSTGDLDPNAPATGQPPATPPA